MTPLRITLRGDGPSDAVLVPILRWLLTQSRPDVPITDYFADFRHLPRPPVGLPEQIRMAVQLYPCDLLLIHRDAEGQSPDLRRAEVRDAVETLANEFDMPYVCVVPVKMSEAWLLFDGAAIRAAAGNPNGRIRLSLPVLRRLEAIPDPKAVLYELLRTASGRTGRQLDKFVPQQRVYRVSRYATDFSPLRELPAFRQLEQDVREFLDGWIVGDE